MFFYGIHTQILPRIDSEYIKDDSESKKIMITFIAGSLLYIIFMSLLNYVGSSGGSDNFLSYTFRNYYTWFFLMDAISLGLHYKVFYRKANHTSKEKNDYIVADNLSSIESEQHIDDEIAAMSDTELY